MNEKKTNMSQIPGKRCDGNSLSEELEYLWDDRDASGRSYEIYLGNISRSPVVKSKTTGKYFMQPWSQIIKVAVKAGIDT